MPEWLEKLKAKPWIAHLLRTQERFTVRLGNQFAGAITYFSVLSLVPVLSFAFAILGMVLTVFRPDLLDAVRALIEAQFRGDDKLGKQVVEVMEGALNSWAVIFGVSLAVFAWSGASWVANLKSAIRAQMRPTLDEAEKKANIVVETLKNLGILLVLLVTILVMFASSTVATVLTGTIIEWLQLPASIVTTLLLRLVPVLVNIVVGFALFAFVYRVSYQQPIARHIWLIGALSGSIGLAVLQVAATTITGLFSGNAAAGVFGPIIVLMLFFNLFATLILMIAAWMATYEVEPVYRSPLAADVADPAPELDEPAPMVRRAVAERAMRAGIGAGWALGAATGVGVGAIVAGIVSWFGRLRSRP
ncbi:MAG: YhjD/YihY/BrkB family envelope integrity protein [Micropruina sp.]|uniref:YhjD/YihY/BrkB family envelope integrity protein n=1 Tax=Micropruina sp. TaxID=2737536 RepID=UPI0039E2EEA4